jgi:hypothetical protein
MFIAHIGVGLASKRIAPRASLGVLLFACQALDILCGLFMVTGLERMKVSPGITKVNPLEFIYYPWSHGIFMSLLWSALAALIAARFYRDRRTGLVVGTLVFSHWALDWISHAPDLPVLFGGSPLLGLGLWNHPTATLVAELAIFGGGLFLLVRTTRPRSRRGFWSLASLVLFFAVAFCLNYFGEPPPATMSPRLLAIPILMFALLWPWGSWIERNRVLREA